GAPASQLNTTIQAEIRRVYQNNVDVYVNLEDRVPVSVFVSGAVRAPGRYAGNPGDSLIDYLTKAGGITLKEGSFREIKIIRNNALLEVYDLYDFLKNGTLPSHPLREGDVLLVGERGAVVNISGAAQYPYAFELDSDKTTGAEITNYTTPLSYATHVTVTGFRGGQPINRYFTMEDFADFTLEDGDKVSFEKGLHENSIKVTITGTHEGAKAMVLPLNARFKEVLANIPVNPNLSRIDAIYLRRPSVAEQQRKSLQQSIKRLQETLLLARASGSSQSMPISQGEIKLLESFITKTEALNPEGRVVVTGRRNIADMALENGDEIVIPAHSDLVTINGEVRLPKAIVWNTHDKVIDYIERSGGFTDNANEDDIIVIRANGETELGKSIKIMPGDEVIVMPEVKINNIDLVSSVADILYKAVLAVAIPIQLGND
ncbi:MAG: SLBB domain-containing protein, partial [Pseudomonadota bacterium]